MSHISEITTPALIVDRTIFEQNIIAAEDMIQGTGKFLRPHFKTHRSPALALRQLSASVLGVTCATVGEAEAVVRAGIKDVLIANEIVTPNKLDRIALLAKNACISICVDSIDGIRSISSAAKMRGSDINVLVDIDVGLGRCGVGSSDEAIRLACEITEVPGLRFLGLMGYEGRVRFSVPDRNQRISTAHNILAETKLFLEMLN